MPFRQGVCVEPVGKVPLSNPATPTESPATTMADDPKSLSQDDIDALINQASGATPAAKASSDATAAPAPAKVPSGPAGTLGQDDIDALINQVQAAAPTTPAAKPAAPSAPAKPAANTGSLGQDDIDALINQVQAAAPSTPAAKPAPVTPAKATAPAAALGQDDIDALINQVQAAAPSAAKPTPKAPTKAAAPAASLGQDDIDALINQVQTPAAAAPTVALDQDAIDALINPPAPSAPAAAAPKGPAVNSKATRESSITQMLDSMQDAATAKAQAGNFQTPTSAADEKSGPLGQDDIDRLLADLGAHTGTKAGPGKPRVEQPSVPTTAVAEAARSQRPGTTSSNASDATVIAPMQPMASMPSGPNAPTLALSAEDLDALVDRQVGVTSEHGEAPMIDQGDIDALVKQLANATGAPDTKRISDALAKHEGEIDKLLEQAGDAKVTMDAIPLSAVQGAGSTGNLRSSGLATLTMPVMAPAELKGTRWLLAAAVLFLAMCAVTLGMVVNAINGLSSELKTQHEAALAPSNHFADDYKAAMAQLSAPDAGDVAKGVLFMSRLKVRHPGHEGEIALALGRHFRAKGSFRQAAEEFAALSETGYGLFDDPRIFLDYAACLSELGDLQSATKQVYRLLANEDRYLAPRDANGLARPADEITRNQQAVQDAYLTLGRMLASASQQSPGRATASHHTSDSPAPAAAAHAPSAHGGH